jgi:hypothetical protein
MMISGVLGKPQIDTTELIRVFGKLSKVSQKKIAKKSQNVAAKSLKKNSKINLTPDELETIITRAVENALNKAIPLLIEQNKTAEIAEPITSITETARVAHTKRKTTLPINRPTIAKKKERRNGYAAAFGLPSVITEVIHLQIMKLHGEGLTAREIEKKVGVSQVSIQRTINLSA